MSTHILGGDCYMCTECSDVFRYPNPLKSHIRFHCRSKIASEIKQELPEESFVGPGTKSKHGGKSTDMSKHKFQPKHDLDLENFQSAFTPARQNNCKKHSISNCQNDKSLHNQNHKLQSMVPYQSQRPSPLVGQDAERPTITVRTPGNLTTPIQIFNHIHTPPPHMPLDYMALSYYYSSLHQARLNMGFPLLTNMIHSPNMSLPQPAMHNSSHGNHMQHQNMWARLQGTREHSTSNRNTSPSHGPCESPPPKSPRETRNVNEFSSEVTPASMFNIPLLSAKEGEPLDLLPRSLYMNKARKGHICVYCGKLYSRKYGLKIHLRTHTGYKPLKCKVCLRPFGDPSNLNKHIRLHAEGDTPYRCPHCGKVLVRRRDLERHISSRHPDKCSLLSSTKTEPEDVLQVGDDRQMVEDSTDDELDDTCEEINVL